MRHKLSSEFDSSRKEALNMDSSILVRVVAGALAIIVASVIIYRRKQTNS
jgi:hypothetical protein